MGTEWTMTISKANTEKQTHTCTCMHSHTPTDTLAHTCTRLLAPEKVVCCMLKYNVTLTCMFWLYMYEEPVGSKR